MPCAALGSAVECLLTASTELEADDCVLQCFPDQFRCSGTCPGGKPPPPGAIDALAGYFCLLNGQYVAYRPITIEDASCTLAGGEEVPQTCGGQHDGVKTIGLNAAQCKLQQIQHQSVCCPFVPEPHAYNDLTSCAEEDSAGSTGDSTAAATAGANGAVVEAAVPSCAIWSANNYDNDCFRDSQYQLGSYFGTFGACRTADTPLFEGVCVCVSECE